MTSTEQAGNRAFGVLTCPNAMKEDSGIKLSITSGYPQISIIQKKFLEGHFLLVAISFRREVVPFPMGPMRATL